MRPASVRTSYGMRPPASRLTPTSRRPGGFLHSLWVLVRSLVVVAALTAVTLAWGPAVQAAHPGAADVGTAVVSGVVTAALCPELWALAAPIPVLIPVVQAFHQAQSVSPYWGDEHDGIIWLVGLIYVAIAIGAAVVARRVAVLVPRLAAR